ncbi:hypothetical protein KI387_042256, partial [Taxus chinensis]
MDIGSLGEFESKFSQQEKSTLVNGQYGPNRIVDRGLPNLVAFPRFAYRGQKVDY